MTSVPSPMPLTDPDLQLLAATSAKLMGEYIKPDADPWAGSPFAWIKTRPSRQIGSIGEKLVADWCAAKGLTVTRTGDSDADRVIAGRRVEIKFSTLWENGDYVFQQIRDQRYDVALLLGLSPFEASCWVVPKPVLREQPFRVGLSHQHGGQEGTDTIWLRFKAASPPTWLSAFGGPLSAAFEMLAGTRQS